MTELNIILLSLLQGFTEFLPVSSSGHLILFSKFTNFPDQGMAFDVALHVGSIIAVAIYFYDTLWQMLKGLAKTYFIPNFKNFGNRLFWLIMTSTIPAVIIGLILKSYGMEWLRNPHLIGWTILIFGLVLYFADKTGMTIRKIEHLSILDAILIGFAQCVAFIPGTSRSGITITMCRILGMERREAAKYSMLMGMPVIFSAGILVGHTLYKAGNFTEIFLAFDAIIYSFIFSILAIYIMMWWLKKSTYLPFVIYRIILGSLLILDSYGYINFVN